MATQAMPSSDVRPLSIAVTMIVSFALTVGVLYWRHRGEAAATTTGSLPSVLPPPVAAAPVAAMPVPAARPTGPLDSAASSPPAAPAMPVTLSFRHPARLGKIVARLYSNADESLPVQASIVSASEKRTVYAQLEVPANGQASLGDDTGYDLQTGDRITLKSPPYEPRVITVP
jgi:hypothetical protein